MTKVLAHRFVRSLAHSVLSPATLLTVPVHAQNVSTGGGGQGATGVEEVVVTGIRESLNKARDIKRDAPQFVDAIVADHIGKLPDRNVAESLARVSGVPANRGIAEGTNVSVRGPPQNVYLFNGRQIIYPTGRGGAGLDTLGSSTYGLLSLVPSELISRLELTKLASSDQIALPFTPTAGLSNATYSDNDIRLSGRATGPVLTNTEFLDTDARHLVFGISGQLRRHRSAESQRRGCVHRVDFDGAPGVFPRAAHCRHQAHSRLRCRGTSAPTRAAISIFPIHHSCATQSCSTTPSMSTDWTDDLDAGLLKAASVGLRYDWHDSE
jgi:hypothetical protein